MRRAVLLLLVLATRPGSTPASAAEPIAWDEAEKHVGEAATVEGTVVGVHCSPLSCLLAFEPSFNRFTAVIQAETFEKLPPDRVEREFTGQRVRVSGTIKTIDGKPEIVSGTIKTIDGKPEIVVADPAALTILREEPDARAQAERAARAQDATVERLDEMISRLAEVTDRLAAIQERLEAILAALAAREAPAPGPVPGPELPPRAGFEALRSIKIGMTPAEVERLAGPPDQVERAGNGWMTWYYASGRSVTFDGRGRARSMTGFAAP